ncbi:hypothetical protein [Luteibacter yeojuensis]|uniref:hypothetical protein n=1 Tax=Luteibacter yeojuensis TaxID=345309 RepID=UPI0012EE26E8|nr:hypothetical protein [Luteibacter yeojuensis]
MLVFRSTTGLASWEVRLVVSTGNWTLQTLTSSLDLAWIGTVDSSASLRSQGDAADVAAAWRFIEQLLPLFDQGALGDLGKDTPTLSHVESMYAKELLASVRDGAPARPRKFIDNQSKALVSQLAARVGRFGGKRRNYIALGSGFFESGTVSDRVPGVLEKIVANLSNAGHLTPRANVAIVVSPEACQSVATSAAAIQAKGWKIVPAVSPAHLGENPIASLHGKFIFSAMWNDKDKRGNSSCKHAWLYLGSGNLTKPGFLSPAGASGNLEAGVIVGIEGMIWRDIKEALPFDPLSGHELSPEDVAGGDPMEEKPDAFIAAPVSIFTSEQISPSGDCWLTPQGTCDQYFHVRSDAGLIIEASHGRFLWHGSLPREVCVVWAGSRTALIPVVDEKGRIAAVPLGRMEIEDVLSQIELFPAGWIVDDPSPDPWVGNDVGGNATTPSPATSASYPIRQAMVLVESIAERQCALSSAEWPGWCVRLGTALLQARGTNVAVYCKMLGINVLSPLRQSPFRPEHSWEPGSNKIYEAMLSEVEQAWGLSGLPSIEADTNAL